MIPYILHVPAITTACFLFYKLLLQKETFYRLNRWTLLGCLAVSFTLPLLPVPPEWSWRDHWAAKPAQSVMKPVQDRVEKREDLADRIEIIEPVNQPRKDQAAETKQVETLYRQMADAGTVSRKAAARKTVAGTPVNKEFAAVSPAVVTTDKGTTTMDRLLTVLQWLFYLYVFGLVVFGGNFLFQLAVLLHQSYTRPVIRDGLYRIVETGGNRAPCSFGNTIFINPANYDWETYNQILIHEKVHVSGRHTLDILLAEMALVLQWFNPFAWLYRREVENNLEFLTDASVLEHGEVERSAYQLSLLRVSAPHLPFPITNNYNQSLLKRRIVMMNSKRSSLHTVWKYFFLIPLLTGLVCALNKPAAYGAGTKTPKTTVQPTADTSRKPRTDTARLVHDPLRKKESQVSEAGVGNVRDDDEQAAAAKMYLDQAMQDTQNTNDAAADVSVRKEAADQARLAQLDMLGQEQRSLGELSVQPDAAMANAKLAMKMDMTARLKTDVDVNIGDMRIPGDSEMLEGSWFATSGSTEGKLQFDLKRESENGSWNNSFSVEKTEFNPYPGQGSVEFKLVREAGTLNFKGQFDGLEGFGHFRFEPNEAYFTALKQMGIEDIDGRRFAFFTTNVKKDYAAMVTKAYPHLKMRDLVGFAAHHIDADYIKYWQGTGITDLENPRTLISLKAQHIDRAYVDELKAAGYDHLGWRELITMKARQIDGAYIRNLGPTKDNQPRTVMELVRWKAMNIDSSYIASLRGLGYGNLGQNELYSLYIQHITADFIKDFQALGYKDIAPHDLVRLKNAGVTPAYVSEMKKKGFESKDLGKYIRLKNDFN